jgi:hypothetical protein
MELEHAGTTLTSNWKVIGRPLKPERQVEINRLQLRLQSYSSCINAGLNAYAPGPTDLDGNRRIISGTLTFTPDGQGVVSWDESIPRPILQTALDGKEYVTWTNTAAGSPPSILEQNTQLQKTGWVRRIPQTSRRYEFDASQVTNIFFRLWKPY